MFSEGFREYAKRAYQDRLAAGAFGALAEEIREGIARLEGAGSEEAEQALLMKFFYGTMPLSDAGDYEFSVFLSYAAHGLRLRQQSPWCRELPEDLFLHYVLYYRVNTEGITPCREFFCQQLADRIRGLSLMEAALEVNYWCAGQAGYAASDDRTLSPMAVYRSGSGRCGEESAFVVSALRSVGIPARQVYAPWWAHCDDNHAWVEVYVDGSWHFLGACEPEEALDRGWFVGAASRALLVHSRAFSDYRLPGSGEEEPCIGPVGSVWYYNSTSRYTKTKELEILVKDQAGQPAGQAVVSIETLNMADYRQLARLVTDAGGRASISIGLGDLHIHARREGWFGAVECLKAEERRVEVVLNRRDVWGKTGTVLEPGKEKTGEHTYAVLWEPPASSGKKGRPLTQEQKAHGRKRRQQEEELRERRLRALWDSQRDCEYEGEQEILKEARGNCGEIRTFLAADSDPDRRSILHSLAFKDYRDVTAATLEAFLGNPWKDEGQAAGQGLYERYVLCPRIDREELTPYPPRIRGYFTREQQAAFRKQPETIWDYIREAVLEDEKETYPDLPGTPMGCLRLGRAGSLGRRSLFVAIARSLGIPARLNPADGEPEFWQAGGFVRAAGQEPEGRGMLCLEAADAATWTYGQNYSIARLMGDQFVPLHYEEAAFRDGKLQLELLEGQYRLITVNRLPSGSQHASVLQAAIASGQCREISVSAEQGALGELLCRNELEDFPVESTAGEQVLLSELLSGGKGILAFLEVGQEPTEHVLNEMLQQKALLSALPHQIIFLLEKEKDLENKTLQAVLEALPGIRVYLDHGFCHAEQAARDMYVEPEKLPLLAAVRPGPFSILGLCGYHVGSVELMARILQLEPGQEE